MVKRDLRAIFLSFTVLLTILLVSCDPAKKYEKEEKNSIETYLSDNYDLNFVLQSSGLYYYEVLTGTGITPLLYDSAYVRYTGKFLDGTVFDSNVTKSTPYGFIVGQNIQGFDEGVMLMKVGGKASLLLPSKLAYGTTGTYGIGGFTPLLFDIELIKVKRNYK